MTDHSEATDSEQPDEYPEQFTDGNGNLSLTDEVKDAISVGPVDDADGPFDADHQYEHKVTHEPTGISEEYTVSEFARSMNPNALNDTARRQLARDHPEILEHHASEDPEPELMTDGGEDAPEGVEFTDRQLNDLSSVLMEQGVSTGTVESVMADLTGEDPPEGSEYVRPDTPTDMDVSEELMNLARHLYRESRNLGSHVKDSEKHHGNGLASAVYQARADGLMDACEEIRQVALWLDGERDRPASLHHGEELAAEGKRVPKGGPSGGDF